MIGPFRPGAITLATIAGLLAAPTVGIAQQQPYFAGKTIQLVVSTGTGGGQDANARLVARHWSEHISGHPAFVVKNMPGAGHLRAANYLANQAPKDGTVLGAIVPAFLLAQVLESSKGIQFDAAKLSWIGSSAASNSTVYVWSQTPVSSMEDAMRRPVLMGATGAGSYTQIYPMILNAIVGTKFKVIAGYATANDVNLAMERGEVQGRAGNNFNSLRMENPDWLRDGKVRFLAQIGLRPDPEYPDLPLMHEFGRSDDDKRLLRLFSADIAVGRPFMGPPGMALDRLGELQRAFDETMADAAFLRDAREMRIDISPVKGPELQTIVADVVSTPPELVNRARQALMDLPK